jgi:hypothetical protein
MIPIPETTYLTTEEVSSARFLVTAKAREGRE